LSPTAAARYRARLRRVLDYIDAHLDEDLPAERLSGVAAFSRFHFHRQFAEFFGIGVYRYVQLKRLRRASWQLAFRHSMPIVQIALANGYEGPEAFARAFRKCIGQSPSAFRKTPQWDPWYATFQILGELRTEHMKTPRSASEVSIVDFPETRVAVFEHRGDPQRIGNSIRRFIEWRKQTALPPSISATFNVLYDDPEQTSPADYRFDLCAATERPLAPNAFGVVAKKIPGGRCAVIRHVGSDDNLAQTVGYLYSEWLPASGEELRDFPIFLQRVTFFPEVPEHEAVTDVFLPLK
jgi:AraC family transcriptional regulator